MGQLLSTNSLLETGATALTTGRYSITAAYAACFYDWIISLDDEVTFIYPAPWNVVKGAYIFCRYYPLAIAPFHFWGFIGEHERHVCESYYRALYACTIPTILSAQFILMLRTYAFSGRKKTVLVVLSIAFLGLVGVIIWVTSKQLSLSFVFFVVKRSGCFAISDQPTLNDATIARLAHGYTATQSHFAYHIGMISILTTFFDCLNMFVVIRHCVRERGTFGPLGQSFLKQGIPVYVIMTALNTLTIGTFFSSQLMQEIKGVGPWFAYILPSALSCRLVLMLRRKASPTETELRVQYSHMVDEALEMVSGEWYTEETSGGSIPSTSTGTQA
ncbi:hypothetical protein EI94DRAFT_1714927 [Lactarius quietus]|nr:hypothetical protein EI94DRAFT_1714927 [Lactarius quietus]